MTTLPETETGAAFAAGHATAAAEQASGDAAMAEISADAAKETAAAAVEQASVAQQAAWATQDMVHGLESKIDELAAKFEARQEPAGDGSAPSTGEGAPAVPAPEKREESSQPTSADGGEEKSKRAGYGSARCFGSKG